MPFSAGQYSLPAGNPVVTASAISSTWANNTLSDISTALSTCILKDGTQIITANIPLAGFKLTGLGAGSAAGNSVRWEQSAPGVVTTAGDLIRGTAAGTITRVAFGTLGDLLVGGGAGVSAPLAIGANGTVPMARSANTTYGMAYVAALGKAIYGFTYANNGNDNIDIAAGGAMDATNAYWLTGAASTKNITTAWAVGSAAGMLDTGSVGNSDYYLWAIARSDTGVVDYLGSLSSTAPTMPANYDYKRLIGWFKRVGAANVAFHTYETEGGGLELNWDAPTLDINLANTLTTARRTDAVKVPLNFSVVAHLNVTAYDATASFAAWICCPDQTDAAPSASVAPLANLTSLTTYADLKQMKIRTSATGTVAARADLATVDTYRIVTLGFNWARRV